jgi:hypothetical protein
MQKASSGRFRKSEIQRDIQVPMKAYNVGTYVWADQKG